MELACVESMRVAASTGFRLNVSQAFLMPTDRPAVEGNGALACALVSRSTAVSTTVSMGEFRSDFVSTCISICSAVAITARPCAFND